MTIETLRFKHRFTNEDALAVRFKGDNDHLIDILDWVIDSGNRAQGDIRSDGGLDLMVHERGVGLVKVKAGEYVVKSESAGFEVLPPLAFTQMYEKVSSLIRVIRKPVVLEAMQFDGSSQNEKDIKAWLAESKHTGKYIHKIRGTEITYYRIELGIPAETGEPALIDIKLNNWIVKVDDKLMPILSLTNDEFFDIYQQVG